MAFEATRICRGEDDARLAQESAIKTFEQGGVGGELPSIEVVTSKEAGIPIDTVNAEISAFMSARTIYSLPMTFPSTTGVSQPIPGGEIYEAN